MNSRSSKRIKLINDKKKILTTDIINGLPPELLEIIFSFIFKSERNRLREVCKYWHAIIKKNTLQDRVFDSKYQGHKLKANNFDDVKDIDYCEKTNILAVVNSKSVKFYKDLKYVSRFTQAGCSPVKIQHNDKFFFAINSTGFITKIDKHNFKYAGHLGSCSRNSKCIMSDTHFYRSMPSLFGRYYLEKFTLQDNYLTCFDIEHLPSSMLIGPDQSLYCSFYPGEVVKFEGKRKRTIYSHIDHIINKMKYYKKSDIIITIGSYTHVDIWSTDFVKKQRIYIKNEDLLFVHITNFFYNSDTKNILIINQCGFEKHIAIFGDKIIVSKRLIDNIYNNIYFIDKYGRFVILGHNEPNFLVY
jgi:hypothetical protein